MPDIFAYITAASSEQIAMIANVLELRATSQNHSYHSKNGRDSDD